MQIREATAQDRDAIRDIHLAAFDESEREVVAALATRLLENESSLSLVAENAGQLTGHVVFSPVTIDSLPGFEGFLLGPLAVKPDQQKQRVGSQLVETGMRQLLSSGAGFLLVYGDPAYYGRFGFSAEIAERFIVPYPLQYPFGWQGLVAEGAPDVETAVEITCAEPLRDPALW